MFTSYSKNLVGQYMIIAFLNQKGGSGKTTLAINVAGCLTKKKKRLLFIDADPQGSALDWSEYRENKALFSVVGLPKATIHREIENLSQGYDHVIIDGPPRIHDVVKSIVAASDIIVIPIQPSPYDIWSAENVLKIIEEASVFNTNLKTVFVINRKIANTAIGRDAKEALAQFSIPVLNTQITQRVIFAESASSGKVVFEVDKNSPAVKEIVALTNEIMRLKNG